MTPDEAKELLHHFHTAQVPEAQAKAEQARTWIGWEVQMQIINGDRSDELATLHTKAMNGDAGAKAAGDAIIQELHRAAERKLAQEGLPPEWRPENN